MSLDNHQPATEGYLLTETSKAAFIACVVVAVFVIAIISTIAIVVWRLKKKQPTGKHF